VHRRHSSLFAPTRPWWAALKCGISHPGAAAAITFLTAIDRSAVQREPSKVNTGVDGRICPVDLCEDSLTRARLCGAQRMKV
ncbi:MAG: hypothetical protein ACRYGP_31810, partial [Janthinobacterium lividum]